MRDVFLIVAGLCIIAAVVLPTLKTSRSSQRRIYWGCTSLASLSGFLAGSPNMTNAIVGAALLFGAMTMAAYAFTPYIKIGGKIYALTVADRQPDPDGPRTKDSSQLEREDGSIPHRADPQSDAAQNSYIGLFTPATMWWMLVVLAVIAAGNVYAFLFSDGEAAIAAVMAAFLALLAAGGGYGDASWGYPIARGQRIPFGVVSVITGGSFAFVYLVAYWFGRRRPLRRPQSMEYRAHPRHQKNQP